MDNNAVNNDSKQYIMVKFDNEQYGIDIAYIDNIVRLQPITRVPHTQDYFLGIINLRGEIIPVMSLRRKFDLEDKENTNSSRILIIKYEGNAKIGMMVDEVKEVVTLSEDDIEKISSDSPDSNRGYLAGVGKYNDTLITLLNIGVIIPTINPYFHPHTNPQINTGICIGQSIEPISGICPVKNGNNKPSAINNPDNVIFKIILCLFIVPPKNKKVFEKEYLHDIIIKHYNASNSLLDYNKIIQLFC